jgi:hypothetical protein
VSTPFEQLGSVVSLSSGNYVGLVYITTFYWSGNGHDVCNRDILEPVNLCSCSEYFHWFLQVQPV